MRKLRNGLIGLLIITVISMGLYFFVKGKYDEKKTIFLTYESNAGVPYKWVYEIEDESIMEFVEAKNVTEEKYKNLDGGRVKIQYYFRGKKRGQTSITFKYVSVATGEAEKVETTTFNVDRYKNVSKVYKK